MKYLTSQFQIEINFFRQVSLLCSIWNRKAQQNKGKMLQMKAIKPCFIKSFCLLSLFFLSLISFLLLGAAVKVHLLTASGSLRSPWADAGAFACRCCSDGAQLCPGSWNEMNPQVCCARAQALRISCLLFTTALLPRALSQGGRFLWLLKATSSLSCTKPWLIQEIILFCLCSAFEFGSVYTGF